jgi:hypothetical protein
MTQGPPIFWADCQPPEHWAQLAGVVLVRRYKNVQNGLMSHCDFRLIHSKVRRYAPDHRAIARICAASNSDVSHPIAIGL